MINHYEILGISESASSEQIKKAYRKLAKEYHPDKNPNNKQAEEHFKKLSNSYEILSDPIKKAAYDNSRKANSYKSKSYQSQANQGKGAPGNGKQHADNEPFNADAFEARRRQFEREMNEREQKIKNREEALNSQQQQFRRAKEKLWIAIVGGMLIAVVALNSLIENKNLEYHTLSIKNDSVALELRSREFLIRTGLERYQLQKVKSILSIYDMSKNEIHDYSSLDTFLLEMRDRQKAYELYQGLLKAHVRMNMNFDQFYRTLKFD